LLSPCRAQRQALLEQERQRARTNTVGQRFPFPNQEIKRKLPLYVVGNKRSLMIAPQICLRFGLGDYTRRQQGVHYGGLDAQTIRLEGNIVSRTAGVRSIIPRYAGPE
jgi:hypothetical protein